MTSLILVIHEEKKLLESFVKASLHKKIENENETPLSFSNRDTLGCNQPGWDKTCAFLLLVYFNLYYGSSLRLFFKNIPSEYHPK